MTLLPLPQRPAARQRATATPVLAVIGPSGAGKSTLVRTLAQLGAASVHPTWTTRPRRDDERDGSLEHRFVSDAVFDDLCRRGFFLESVSLFGLPYRYGLPPIQRSGDRPDLVMLRAPLVPRLAEFYPDHLVYQIEDTPDRAAERLRARGSSPADVIARLEDNEREMVAGRAVAHRVFVNDGRIDELASTVIDAMAEDLR